MKVTAGIKNQVINNVFSGVYYQRVTGLKGKVYEFSSPNYPVSNFPIPYDAFLQQIFDTGSRIVAAGNRLKRDCPISSDRTGILYFYDNFSIVGACHGFGHNDKTYYSGFNYYNAFYPAGYFSPPFGENLTIFKGNIDGYNNLQNGSCNQISATEYNEQFGIVSKTVSEGALLSSTLTPNIYAPINSPKEACPPELVSLAYFDEIQFTQIPGTVAALGGNDFHNSNPIPTSLDNFDIKVNGRYTVEEQDNDDVVVEFINGRPAPSYSASTQANKLNNTLCQASIMEQSVNAGRGSNGTQLIAAPDALYGIIGDQVSFAGYDTFHYWHFIFKENAATLPFLNNFNLRESSKLVRVRAVGEGTQLFLPVLSSDDYYWQNRQCPSTVDFLPWTFGASIYACPSEHFDVPYYAAIKRFGFYGTRFVNSCKALQLDYSVSGIENAMELPDAGDYILDPGTLEPDFIDKEGDWSFSSYNNLLKVAKAEENYANMYALNKGFFLWANSGLIVENEDYKTLGRQNSGVAPLFSILINKFQNVFQSGLSSFVSGEPNVTLKVGGDSFIFIESGRNHEILLTNAEYLKFRRNLENILTPPDYELWNRVESKYAYYVASAENVIHEEFYRNIVSGREKRLMTRYFENIVRGNPIDLFPLNSVTFSFDTAKDYIEHTGWGRRQTVFGETSSLPEVNRRYFEGAYGRSSAITGLVEVLSALSDSQTDYYYPGFFNDIRFDKNVPTSIYKRAVSGIIVDSLGRSFSPSGWLGLGYNEVGGLDGNFSCFTPIFVQQPLPRVFCKIGQRATFRTLAVDYHTIPEDKISRRYPEIIYWCQRLKMLDCNSNYLYPMKYQWYRVNKTGYNNFISSGTPLALAERATNTGAWGCLGGEGPDCSFFNPKESYPLYSGVQSEGDYTFIKGAQKNIDDKYYYLCLASGRFGIRLSNPTELNIENWLRFDISVKNGTNNGGAVKVDFDMTDHLGAQRKITFDSETSVLGYGGYQQDTNTTPETVIEQKIPPPNAGWGDVVAFRFIGPAGYIGATRSYIPSNLKDTRGLREVWGHMLEYGQLVPLSKTLSQQEGDWLYGYSHLPVCENYAMANGKKGIKATPYINGKKVLHWSLDQKAVASLDNKAGIQWDKLFNLGELYPPINSRFDFVNFGIGHWQWGNNLGSIKRFGKLSTYQSDDIQFVGGHGIENQSVGNVMVEKVKDKIIGPTDLAGSNCGYTQYGLGRNMIYYLEAYERFYIICDALKKKNVTNKSFICPGVRLANSAIQYFWLGRPSNTFVKRRPMYGPYAYQWRVSRHNRDRNGNGISEGFYSMGYNQKYSLMYDAPATYGLYVKKDTNSAFLTLLNEVKELRAAAFQTPDVSLVDLRNVWFGERRGEGTARRYGNMTFSCIPSGIAYNKEICEYVSTAQALATNIDFKDHVCPQDLVADGQCFDPCMSMRYAQGFFPGGKSLDLFGYNSTFGTNTNSNKNVKLIPLAKIVKDGIQIGDEQAFGNDQLIFRPPLDTPHARITQGMKTIAGSSVFSGQFIGGITPCQDGGSDHCNYITPTIHLGVSSYLEGQGTAHASYKNYIANVFENTANIRGEIS